jgi:hypothetical protein
MDASGLELFSPGVRTENLDEVDRQLGKAMRKSTDQIARNTMVAG